METLLRNARYGVRVLLRAPAFTVVAVLTLALGIGANAAVFSIVNALLIRPLPLPASDRLVSVLGVDKDGQRQYLSMPDFEDLRGQARLVEGFSAFVPQSANLTGRAEPQRVRAGFVSGNFFDVVAVKPAIGRGLLPGVDDVEGAPRVCVVQHETWQGLFGGDSGLLGTLHRPQQRALHRGRHHAAGLPLPLRQRGRGLDALPRLAGVPGPARTRGRRAALERTW